jgi:excisionase family DNA binding protein
MTETIDSTARLGDVNTAALKLNLSAKTIRRMADAGKMPGVIRLGRLLRFDLCLLDRWIDQGCPPLHRFSRTARNDIAT